jgi:hypothetical protein
VGGVSPSYDEQVGLTFTDPFSSLDYNVTAVAQSNSDGYGPAYLLNGLNDKGDWYQVGLSWNWSPGDSPGTGFSMNYEAWDASGNSVFPASGGGGLLSYSGQVNQGDRVQLSLSFAQGEVIMSSKDLDTGASASTRYNADGGSMFQGLLRSADSNGYFSGLMTEEYHSSPYYGNMEEVTYSSSTPLGNGFLWADEWNFSATPPTTLFDASKFVSFLNPSLIQSFSKNGTSAYANSTTFITGALNKALLTLSYSVYGGGAGVVAPSLTYISNGTKLTVALTTTPETFLADMESTWQVSSSLLGGSAEERWTTTGLTGGTLSSSITEELHYYHQYLCKFGYSVTGGAAGFGPPGVQITQGGLNITVEAGPSQWADAQTGYVYPAIQNSAVDERWAANGNLSGVVNGPVSPVIRYFHQFGLSISYVLLGGGSPDPPLLSGTASGATFSSPVANSTVYFLDSGTAWSAPDTLSSGNLKERWIASQETNGTMSAPSTFVLTYQNQYSVSVYVSPTGAGTVTHPNPWENVGSTIRLSQNASKGWKLAYWLGAGTDTSNSTTLQVNAPVIETAVFYPGLQIVAGSNGAVTYAYGNDVGTVPPGTSKTIYAGPEVEFTLQATPSSFLYAFSGWSRNSTGTNSTTTVLVETPKSVAATFALNVPIVAGFGVVALVAVVVTVAFALRNRTKPRQST